MGTGDAHGAEVVGVDVAAEQLEVALESAPEGEHAGVVDQQVDVRGRSGGRVDGGLVGHVEAEGTYARVGHDGRVDRVQVAGRRVDGPGACGQQLGDETGAQAAVGSGDQSGAAGDVHEVLL